MSLFSNRLKELRKAKKVTQKMLAESIDMSERNYQSLEYGKIKPSYDTIINLADFFDVSTDYLLGRSDDPARH